MVHYRRNLFQGGTYFFTVTLRNRKEKYLVEYINFLRFAMNKTKQKLPYTILAIVVLPEHLHTVWKLPENDADYSTRWRLIKSYFSHSLMKQGVPLVKDNRGQYNLWQNRYWEHTIRDEHDLQKHVDYIHYNPVKHGLVKSPIDWPYSSFHWYVRNNLLTDQWGFELDLPMMDVGE